jgi:hypothetical protein
MHKTLKSVMVVGFHLAVLGIFIYGLWLTTIDFGCAQDISRPIGNPCPFYDSSPAYRLIGYEMLSVSFVLELLYYILIRPWLVLRSRITAWQKLVGIILVIALVLLSVYVFTGLSFLGMWPF